MSLSGWRLPGTSIFQSDPSWATLGYLPKLWIPGFFEHLPKLWFFWIPPKTLNCRVLCPLSRENGNQKILAVELKTGNRCFKMRFRRQFFLWRCSFPSISIRLQKGFPVWTHESLRLAFARNVHERHLRKVTPGKRKYRPRPCLEPKTSKRQTVA